MKTGIGQKVLLQSSVCERYIDILEKDATGFSMAYDDYGNFHISDSGLQLIIPPQ